MIWQSQLSGGRFDGYDTSADLLSQVVVETLEGFKNVPSVDMLDSGDYAWIAAKGDQFID
jgi:hypothetical protein